MKYLCTIYGEESAWSDATPEQMAEVMAAYTAFGEEAGAAGVILGGEGLEPTSAATMELGGPTSADIIERATRSTLAKAEELGARSLALVAFGTGVGGFPVDDAARIMVAAAREHTGELERIVFAVHGEDAERAFRDAL